MLQGARAILTVTLGGIGFGPGALRDIGKNRLFRASGAVSAGGGGWMGMDAIAPTHPHKIRLKCATPPC